MFNICPTCGKKLPTESGVRQHHTKVHGEKLPNLTCKNCGEDFYHPKSDREYCSECWEVLDGIQPKPEGVEIPESESWTELTPYQRWYYKNREEEIERSKRQKKRLREWYFELKKDYGCSECGESHPACIDFHHEGEKEKSVSEMIHLMFSKDKILDEIDRCVPLCSNCHRKHHSDYDVNNPIKI